jgi:hypothetical protein
VAADPGRRAMLTAAVAVPLLLAGCKGVGALGPLPALAPDVVSLGHAITAEELMVARYQAALGALTDRPHITALLAALLAEHQAHLVQLRSRLILPPRLATASPSASPGPSSPTVPVPPPAGVTQVLAELTAAERAACARLARQLLDAPPELAQLMASIGASEATHIVVLARARRS